MHHRSSSFEAVHDELPFNLRLFPERISVGVKAPCLILLQLSSYNNNTLCYFI